MKRPLLLAAAVGAVVVVVLAAVLVLTGGDDEPSGEGGDATSSSGPSLASDEEWCAGWDRLVQAQGVWVSQPDATNADAVIAALDGLEELGAPESLDPAGYTEMGAVLDDVRGSVDPTFTPSVAPSEPADVESDNAADAPFGAWLAEYCPR